jgi:crotonobetaine/carnitine-CoA ligase
MTSEELQMYRNRARLVWRLLRSISLFMVDEYRRGTLRKNLRAIAKGKSITSLAEEMSHAELLEEKAAKLGNKPFLYFKDQVLSYRDMDSNANRMANFLQGQGGGPGIGVAIIMTNSPRWLDVFFGMEKLGMYGVPVNVALRGDQLAHVINNSQASLVVIDHDLLPLYEAVAEKLEGIKKVVVNTEGAPADYKISSGMENLDRAYGKDSSTAKPAVHYDPEDLCVIMYTSGTTGLPKGVVYRYKSSTVKPISIVGRLLCGSDDVAYTCYPLFHANALFLTVTPTLHCGGSVALGERFSASRFWDELRRYNATTFNGLGAVMPILMKQPAKASDRDNEVRFILSAGCPEDMWRAFEERFDLKIYEGYGAVDGGGVLLVNFGTAPVGSMGKPLGSKIRVIDSEGDDVPPRVNGELICHVGEHKSSVEYYRNADATNDKVRNGWLYTGDLVWRDEQGYVYFVGRNTESMRVKGENVSAYEVEQGILQHPNVLECAVYAVPAELAEDEIMASVVPVEGKSLDPAGLREFLKDKLAKFAIPRYYRIMDELPKTETHRVIKKKLEELGITQDTYDAERKAVKQ